MITQAQLIAPTALPAAAGTQLPVPVNTTMRIARAGFSNPTAGAIAVTAYLVASGGSPSSANVLINGQVVAAGSTYVSPELAGLVMPAGSTLQCLGAGLVLYASGVSIQ